MNGQLLKEAREARGWTQAETSRRLKVTQAYVSMLERERRPLSAKLARRAVAALSLPPLAMPLSVGRRTSRWESWSDDDLAQELGSYGYLGFGYLKNKTPRWNPADLLLAMLTRRDLDPRLREALPWLPFFYRQMDWDWTVREAKLHDVQNRLGFVMTLARLLMLRRSESIPFSFDEALARLQDAKLAKEDTLCHESMTQVERRWLREHRPPEAVEWNLLTDLKLEHVAYAED